MNTQRSDILSQIKEILLTLIRCELTNSEVDETTKRLLENQILLSDLFIFSKRHDLSHLMASVLSKNDMLAQDEISKKYQQQMMMAVYRYEQKKHVLEELKNLLGSAKIPHIPLKGSVVQKLYPTAWLRTSCDIDILIHQEDVDKAIELLNKSGYKRQSDATTHDHSFIAPGKVHLELHYSLNQGEQMQETNAILDTVWEHSTLDKGTQYCYQMDRGMFVFYHIAHMAKHFIAGGCGIRPFIDLYLLKNNDFCDSPQLSVFLKKANLTVFYESAMKLVGVWFENKSHDNITEPMESFVLTGGVYGSTTNSAAVKAAKGESKIKTFWKLMFLSRTNLEIIYPNLRKHPMLLPFYQIKRWFRIFTPQKRKRITDLTTARNSVTKNEIDSVANLLEGLELK